MAEQQRQPAGCLEEVDAFALWMLFELVAN
jgi:hypothetical protein